MLLAYLGNYVLRPEHLKDRTLANMKVKRCIKHNKRLILIFKPNLMPKEDSPILFTQDQIEQILIFEKVFRCTRFPEIACLREKIEMEKETPDSKQQSDSEEENNSQQSQIENRLIEDLLDQQPKMLIRLFDNVNKIIVNKDQEQWSQPLTMSQWGVFLNPDVLISQFHNTESPQILGEKTNDQMSGINKTSKDLLLVNNITLTLSKNKKQFLMNMIHLNIPTISNLFSKLRKGSWVQKYIFQKLKEYDKWRYNIFKFDFVHHLAPLLRIMISSNSTRSVQILYLLIYNKKTRKFVKSVKNLDSFKLPNGMLLIPDLPKFVNEAKKELEQKKNEKQNLQNKIIVIYKIEKSIFYKWYYETNTLDIGIHNSIPFSSERAMPVTFPLRERSFGETGPNTLEKKGNAGLELGGMPHFLSVKETDMRLKVLVRDTEPMKKFVSNNQGRSLSGSEIVCEPIKEVLEENERLDAQQNEKNGRSEKKGSGKNLSIQKLRKNSSFRIEGNRGSERTRFADDKEGKHFSRRWYFFKYFLFLIKIILNKIYF